MNHCFGKRLPVILSLFCVLCVCLICKADECFTDGDIICKCKFNNGSVIDLRPVSPKGEPLFKDVRAHGPFNDTAEYSYNPCYEFKEGNGGCKDGVTVCQKTEVAEYALGHADNSRFFYDETSNQLFLLYKEKGRITNVTLICSRGMGKSVKHEVLGESEPGFGKHYFLKLTTGCACPDECIEKENSGLSTGSVLVVLFFVFLGVYFFGGIMYLKIVRGASGSEAIPNYDFWVDFPLLVRDGVLFLLNCCRAETTYERI